MKETAMKTKRKKSEKLYTPEDVKFVFANYGQMSASEISELRGLARSQVTNIVNGLRTNGLDIPKKTGKDIIKDFVIQQQSKKTKSR